MKIEYEESKCSCCKLVHVNSLLISVKDSLAGLAKYASELQGLPARNENSKFIICLDCATNIHEFMSKIKASK